MRGIARWKRCDSLTTGKNGHGLEKVLVVISSFVAELAKSSVVGREIIMGGWEHPKTSRLRLR